MLNKFAFGGDDSDDDINDSDDDTVNNLFWKKI